MASMPQPIKAPAQNLQQLQRTIANLHDQITALSSRANLNTTMIQPPTYTGTPSNQITPDTALLSGSLGSSGGGYNYTITGAGVPGSIGGAIGGGIGGVGGIGGAGSFGGF